jgi:hypothetical protein
MDNNYYTYAYLREDRTPYYIGRGKGGRAFEKRHRLPVPPKDRVLFLKTGLSFSESVDHEKYMISVLGRKDLGNGILRNLTDGGEGSSNPSSETRAKLSAVRKNKPLTPEHKAKISEAARSASPEVKLRKAASKKGVPRSEETKRKISEAKKGSRLSEETIRKRTETRVRNNNLRRLGLL